MELRIDSGKVSRTQISAPEADGSKKEKKPMSVAVAEADADEYPRTFSGKSTLIIYPPNRTTRINAYAATLVSSAPLQPKRRAC